QGLFHPLLARRAHEKEHLLAHRAPCLTTIPPPRLPSAILPPCISSPRNLRHDPVRAARSSTCPVFSPDAGRRAGRAPWPHLAWATSTSTVRTGGYSASTTRPANSCARECPSRRRASKSSRCSNSTAPP